MDDQVGGGGSSVLLNDGGGIGVFGINPTWKLCSISAAQTPSASVPTVSYNNNTLVNNNNTHLLM